MLLARDTKAPDVRYIAQAWASGIINHKLNSLDTAQGETTRPDNVAFPSANVKFVIDYVDQFYKPF